MLRTQVVTLGSPEYQTALELRLDVLRRPLGLGHLSSAELEREPRAVHLGCFAGSELAGVLLLEPASPGCVQMRQVAVATERQRQGIGSALVRAAETWCRHAAPPDQNCLLFAHAREQALPFYRRLDYAVVGAPFTEVGLPHQRVEKILHP